MAPTFCNAAAEARIAVKPSLLNFFFVVKANLHKVSICKQLANLLVRQPYIDVCLQTKSKQFIVLNVCAVILGKLVPVDPIISAAPHCQDSIGANMLFQLLLQQAVITGPVTYQDVAMKK